MMRIIAVGKVTEGYLKKGIEDYGKRMPSSIEWIEIPDEATEKGLKREGEKILKRIRKDDYVACLAIKGKTYSSEAFASLLNEAFTYHGGDLVFVIGGSYGLDQAVLERANLFKDDVSASVDASDSDRTDLPGHDDLEKSSLS